MGINSVTWECIWYQEKFFKFYMATKPNQTKPLSSSLLYQGPHPPIKQALRNAASPGNSGWAHDLFPSAECHRSLELRPHPCRSAGPALPSRLPSDPARRHGVKAPAEGRAESTSRRATAPEPGPSSSWPCRPAAPLPTPPSLRPSRHLE